MDYYMKLPRNKKEFALFMLIVSLISVNIIAPLVAFCDSSASVLEWNIATWGNTYKIIPIIWLCVIALVLLTYVPANKLTEKILKKEDSFRAHMIINTMCTVLMMSFVLTLVAPIIACAILGGEPHTLDAFITRWPRNFAIAFAIETLVAQPIARAIMNKMHIHMDKKTKNR